MPKLNKKLQAEAAKAEAWKGEGRRLLPEGRYAGRLAKVTEYQKSQGYDTWGWQFRHLHGEDGVEIRGQQTSFTSLSPKAAGNLRAHYEALGYSLDSDTDEMIGEWAVLFIVQETAERGKRAGQLVNNVAGISEFDPDDWDFNPEDIPADKDEDDSGAAGSGGDDEF